MKLNIQEVLGDVHPMFKKFVQDGRNPATYITKNKRRQFYEYMNRDTIAKRKSSLIPLFIGLDDRKFNPVTEAQAASKLAADPIANSVFMQSNQEKQVNLNRQRNPAFDIGSGSDKLDYRTRKASNFTNDQGN